MKDEYNTPVSLPHKKELYERISLVLRDTKKNHKEISDDRVQYEKNTYIVCVCIIVLLLIIAKLSEIRDYKIEQNHEIYYIYGLVVLSATLIGISLYSHINHEASTPPQQEHKVQIEIQQESSADDKIQILDQIRSLQETPGQIITVSYRDDGQYSQTLFIGDSQRLSL